MALTLACSVNDILSVKKEIVSFLPLIKALRSLDDKAEGAALSLIPILYANGLSPQDARDHIMSSVRRTRQDFDEDAERLLKYFENESIQIRADLQKFIDGCRFHMTGDLAWR